MPITAQSAVRCRLLKTVEPKLRSRATLGIDITLTVEQVVAAILDHVLE
jgi:hypothetical protein